MARLRIARSHGLEGAGIVFAGRRVRRRAALALRAPAYANVGRGSLCQREPH